MANIKIRKTADNTTLGDRTFSWEIYDKNSPSAVLASGSSTQLAVMYSNNVLRDTLNSLLDNYLNSNGLSTEDTDTGISLSVQKITLTSNYTLVSQTALQKMFNVPTNGAITLKANSTYYFETNWNISSMSASSGTFSFGFLGTASITRVKYWSNANKAGNGATASLLTLGVATTATALVGANTTTTGKAVITGKIVVGTGGTLIPAVGLSVAATAVIQQDSYFKIYLAGSDTTQSIGDWT